MSALALPFDLPPWMAEHGLAAAIGVYVLIGMALTARILRRAGLNRLLALPPFLPLVFFLAPGYAAWALLGVPMLLWFTWQFAYAEWPKADRGGAAPKHRAKSRSRGFARAPKPGAVAANGSATWLLSGFDRAGHALRFEIVEAHLAASPQGWVIGRHGRLADIAIGDDSISRCHARIGLAQGRLIVEDLGSQNGTLVDGARLVPNRPCAVEHGAGLELGGAQLTLTRSQ